MSNRNKRNVAENKRVQETKNLDQNQGEKQIKGYLYCKDDIDAILQLLSRSKVGFEDAELFYALKTVLLHPIPFDSVHISK